MLQCIIFLTIWWF